jgi:p-aminobenzoyl-glutamate transporter AbgT
MFRSILNLLVLGFVGIAALSVVFGVVIPIVTWLFMAALKIAFIALIVYVIMRVVAPDKAEKMREKIRRVK